MTQSPSDSTRTITLPSNLCGELWRRVSDRLRQGDVLLTNEDFRRVLEEMYSEVTGSSPQADTQAAIKTMVETVNRDHPETYLAQGMQNSVNRAFEEGVKRLNWDVKTIQEKGARTFRRFSQQDSIRELLEEANLTPEQLDALDAIRMVVDDIAGPLEKDEPKSRMQTPATMEASDDSSPALAPEVQAPAGSLDADAQAAVESGEVDASEAKRRVQQQEKRRGELEEKELAKVPDNLDSYVEQGIVTEDEAAKVRELHAVDEKVKSGEIDEKEATEIRNSILAGSSRDKIERKIKEAVADSVRYIQVFESMQKIDPKYFDALGLLIEHKNLVTAASGSDIDLSPIISALMGDVELIDLTVDIMERKDQEIRMLSVRLHPYNAIMNRGLERIGNMVIEESFIEDLQKLGADDLSERLNSSDQQTRVKPAADIRCMISLVDHVTKQTRFRKELRLLRIAKQLEEFYSSTSDVKEARHQAENFLNRRLRRIFPDLTSDEAAELKQRSTEMMDQIEQRVLDERQSAVSEREAKEAASAAVASSSGGGDDEMELSEDEIKKGVQIGRVEMRVAGSTRRIPQKMMPDPDDPAQMVICQRDPETGELAPAMKRGSKRIVERGRDGSWQEAK